VALNFCILRELIFAFVKALESVNTFLRLQKILQGITPLFNNMRILNFKAQPKNAFFATVNQMFGGYSKLPTTAEHCFVVRTVLNNLVTARSAVVVSWEEPPNIGLTVAKNAFFG